MSAVSLRKSLLTWTLCSILLGYIQFISFQLLFRSENRSIGVWTQCCHRIKRKTETHYTVSVWCLCAWRAQWQKNRWIKSIFATILCLSVLITQVLALSSFALGYSWSSYSKTSCTECIKTNWFFLTIVSLNLQYVEPDPEKMFNSAK